LVKQGLIAKLADKLPNHRSLNILFILCSEIVRLTRVPILEINVLKGNCTRYVLRGSRGDGWPETTTVPSGALYGDHTEINSSY
jgi:hypothetical protein